MYTSCFVSLALTLSEVQYLNIIQDYKHKLLLITGANAVGAGVGWMWGASPARHQHPHIVQVATTGDASVPSSHRPNPRPYNLVQPSSPAPTDGRVYVLSA